MKFKDRYRISTLVIASIICLVVIYLHLLSHDNTRKIYLKQTEETIIDLKKDFLKDTVNNIFLEIDRLRETKYNNYKKNIESTQRRFQEELDLKDKEFVKFFIDRFDEHLNPKMWTALMWDDQDGEILYGSSDVYIDTIDGTIKNLESLLSSYSIIEKGNIKAIFGVRKSYIDEMVKQEIENTIRSRNFSNESYIWVNEVINYEGGENYAIRKFILT